MGETKYGVRAWMEYRKRGGKLSGGSFVAFQENYDLFDSKQPNLEQEDKRARELAIAITVLRKRELELHDLEGMLIYDNSTKWLFDEALQLIGIRGALKRNPALSG